MLKTKYIILLIAVLILLCISFLTIVCFFCKPNPAIEITNKTYALPHKQIFYNSQSFEDGRVVYLECIEAIYYSCKIKQEKYPYTNTSHSCDVHLVVDGTQRHPYVHVVPFGENRTILVWEDSKKDEGTFVRIAVFDLNECKKTQDFLLQDSRFIYDGKSDLILEQLINKKKIVIHNNSFDIFFKDPRRYVNRECKLSINDEGRSSGIVPYMNNDGYFINDVYSVATNLSGRVYFYSEYISDEDDNRLFRFANGMKKQLASIGKKYALSVVNDIIGVCLHPQLRLPNVTCLQYNADGELKLNFSYTPVARTYENVSEIETHIQSIYTLPEEGFFVQFTDYKRCPIDRSCGPSDILGYYIVRLDVNGKEVGRYYIEKYVNEFPVVDAWHIWKNQEKEGYYCTSLLRQHYGKYVGFNHTATCFTDDILSM